MGDKWPMQKYKQNFTEFIESYEVAHKKFRREKAQGISSYDSVIIWFTAIDIWKATYDL